MAIGASFRNSVFWKAGFDCPLNPQGDRFAAGLKWVLKIIAGVGRVKPAKFIATEPSGGLHPPYGASFMPAGGVSGQTLGMAVTSFGRDKPGPTRCSVSGLLSAHGEVR